MLFYFLLLEYVFCFSLQVKLSRLCEQDKILQELEATIRTLKEDKVCAFNIKKYLILPLYVHVCQLV